MSDPQLEDAATREHYHHGDLPAALIRAGTEILERFGLEQFSLRTVARQVGVSASAPYRHFADRQALLRAIASAGYRHLAGELSERQLSAPKAARHLSRFATKNPGWWDVMVGERSEAEGGLEESRAELLAELVGAVERSQGIKDPEATIREAVAIWAIVVGAARLKTDGAIGLLEEWMVPSAQTITESLLKSRLPRPIVGRRP